MAKKKTNRKGEIKMTEEIKNEEQVVTEEVKPTVSNEGEENANNETEITEVIVNNDETVIEPEQQEPNPEDPEVKPEELEETEEQNEIQLDEVKEACVVKCEKLNVRKEASKTSDVVCVISKDAALTVSITKSTEDFYKVYTVNNEVLVEGYCVKEFIKIK